MVASVVLLLNAGHEASVNVFGNGLVAMLRRGLRPGADVALRSRRCCASTPRCSCSSAPRPRTSRSATSSSRRGRRSRCCSARPTATRPCSTRPDEFRVDRDPNNHVAFGVGRALLPGRPAGADGAGGVAAAPLGGVPAWRLAGEPESRGTFVLRGFRRVRVGGRQDERMARQRRRDRHQAGRRRLSRQPDRLGGRRLHRAASSPTSRCRRWRWRSCSTAWTVARSRAGPRR